MTATNLILHIIRKYIELVTYFVDEKDLQKKIKIQLVSSVSIGQVANVLTKTILSSKFLAMRNKLRVGNISLLRREEGRDMVNNNSRLILLVTSCNN